MTQDPTPPQSTAPAVPDVEDPLAKARALFVGNATLGTPETPTPAGFLALAREGKKVWNAWRKAYPDPEPNFRGLNFREGAVIDFTDFIFGSWASFVSAQFDDSTNFKGAQFGDETNFKGAQFGHGTNFACAQFGDGTNLQGVQFGDRTHFACAQFGDRTSFQGAQFGDETNFKGAQFGHGTRFDDAHFKKASFESGNPLHVQYFWEISLGVSCAQQRANFAGVRVLRSDAFYSISFCRVQFEDDVSFQGRTFLDTTDFGQTSNKVPVYTSGGEKVIPKSQSTRFQGIPNFHGCTLYQNTSFDGAEFLAPSSAEAARAYRTLKLAFAQQHAIREEQHFFRLEMLAETGMATGYRKRLFKLYEKISDFGFSLKRPLKFWLYCLIGFVLIYGLLTGTYGWDGNIDWERTMQWMQYALLNAVPLPGFDKTLDVLRGDLFPKMAIIQLLLTMLEIAHKTVSLVAFFLFGLALRNLFKMKG